MIVIRHFSKSAFSAICVCLSVATAYSQITSSDACSDRPVPQFMDVTASAGIRFRHTSGPAKNYIPESMSGGVLLIDYDRDGWLDIYFTDMPTVSMMQHRVKVRSALYHNNHDGTFTDVTDQAGVAFPCAAMGGAVGDYNNDGWPDMYITCLGGNVLYRNNGDGTFTNAAAQAGVIDGRWSSGAAFADYDGDGNLDLMVANYVDFDLRHLPEPGSLSTCMYRSLPVQCGPHGLKGASDSLFRNNGDGTFTNVSKQTGIDDAQGYYGLGVLWGDFDGSGHPSLFVANDSTPNYLYENFGHGSFKEIGLSSGIAVNSEGKEQANMGATSGDYLHTGRESIYTTTFSDEEKPLYRNDGGMNFKDVADSSSMDRKTFPLLGWGTSFADFDNDGWLDLLTVYGHVYPQVDALKGSPGYREAKSLFLNQRDGSFCNASAQAGEALKLLSAARGLAVGDLFNDGNIDAVIENLDGPPILLQNRGAAQVSWIEFELAGTTSNRAAIGAELTLTAGGTTQMEEIRSGGSYLSQNDLRAHFGLASASRVDRVEVRWPSGHVDILRDLPADHLYAVLEGHGIVERRLILPTAKLSPKK